MSKAYEPHTVQELSAMTGAGLGNWGLGPEASARLISLSENATFLASDPSSGREIVIRVQRLGYSSKEAVLSELAWVNALIKDHAADTAAPVKAVNGDYLVDMQTSEGESRVAVAFEKLNGREPDLTQSDLAHWMRVLGRMTARLHAHARAWQRPAWFTRRRWDFDAMFGPQAYWGSWREAQGLDAQGAEIMEKTLGICRKATDEFGCGSENFGLIHADLRVTNILADGDRLHLIDFDDAGFCWYLFDFAAALSYLEQDPRFPEFARAWVEGYEEVRKLSARERAMLPYFSIMRRIELSAWCGSHSEVPFAARNGAQVTCDSVRLCRSFLEGKYLDGL
jgi:Ser/Thr protein kinase RdoA (MazF antagonist)